jgi:hypothetical protein
MVRFLLAVVISTLLLVAPSGSASASAEWCEFDPVVLIVTPGGAIVPVYVTSGALGIEHLLAAQLAEIRYQAQPGKAGKSTRVRLQVLIRDDLFDSKFPTRSAASTGPLATGLVYARASGVSGGTMEMAFVLDIP